MQARGLVHQLLEIAAPGPDCGHESASAHSRDPADADTRPLELHEQPRVGRRMGATAREREVEWLQGGPQYLGASEHVGGRHDVALSPEWISWRLRTSTGFSRRARMARTMAAVAVRVVTRRTPCCVALLRMAPSS